MSDYLCISVLFLDPRFHGRGDGGDPEWPPSPLRLFQALIAANADLLDDGGPLVSALDWLEAQPPPFIVAPRAQPGEPYRLSVPNNAMDLVGKAWSRGNYFGSGDSNPATHRSMKTIRPTQMVGDDMVSYLWKSDDKASSADKIVAVLAKAARRLVALGWGIDLAVGKAQRVSTSDLDGLTGHTNEVWKPSPAAGMTALRTPIKGTRQALSQRYESFISRITDSGFIPTTPLAHFAITEYRRDSDPVGRPVALFELRDDDDAFYRHPQSKLMHIAGMVRHLAIQLMDKAPPRDVPENWVDTYVAGHMRDNAVDHRQFSYLPMPSLGHRHADPGIRRVMIAAPLGDDALLDHLATRLAGQRLVAERGDEFAGRTPPVLIKVHQDKVAQHYLRPANRWASFTPVILPGHDDHKPQKTAELIERSLRQAGIVQPCRYEYSAFSRFPKALSAHKYDRQKRPAGYLRPDHLQSLTAVHLTLTFDNDVKVPGPLVIGAGRHCGFGLMAGID